MESSGLDGFLATGVEWLRIGVEGIGALMIAIGVTIALGQLARSSFSRQAIPCNDIRLTLARYLSLALEFQLGADILATAMAPSWEQLGKLGAIAVIRTGLNFFLMRETREQASVV
jgi:uncharacterized membrane protein